MTAEFKLNSQTEKGTQCRPPKNRNNAQDICPDRIRRKNMVQAKRYKKDSLRKINSEKEKVI
jgi:hypothetical protein